VLTDRKVAQAARQGDPGGSTTRGRAG